MRWLVMIGIFTIVGCSGQAGSPMPLDQLPQGHLDIAQKRLPNVRFESASKLADGTYEIRGKDARGKRQEVEIHPDGKVTLD